MKKHTQREWSYKDNKIYSNILGRTLIATVNGFEYLSDNMSEEAEANAKLISAAPDILEALKKMLFVFDRGLPDGSIGRRTCDDAIEAIKKATE